MALPQAVHPRLFTIDNTVSCGMELSACCKAVCSALVRRLRPRLVRTASDTAVRPVSPLTGRSFRLIRSRWP
jgi:hypothetical protein